MVVDTKDRVEVAATVANRAVKPPENAGHPRVRWAIVCAVVMLLALIAVGIHQLAGGTDLEELDELGYPGIFLWMAISGASVLFPVGGQAGIFAAGAVWNPLLIGLAAGLGNATGELTAYGAGRFGGTALDRRQMPRWWNRMQQWLRRHGVLTILVLAAVPNPIFKVVGFLAGSSGYPGAWRFWLACAAGNSFKYGALAFIGGAAWQLFGG